MALPQLNDVPQYEFTTKSSGKVLKYIGTKYGHQRVFGLALESARNEEDTHKAIKIINDVLRQVLGDCLISHKLEELTCAEIEELWLNVRASSSTSELKISFKAAKACADQGHPLHNVSTADILDYSVESVSGKTIDDIAKKHNMTKRGDGWAVMITETIGMTLRVPTDFKSNDTDTMKLVIKNIFDAENVYEDYTDEEMTAFIENLPRNATAPIEDFINALPTVCLSVEIKCPECEHTRQTKLKGIYDFFV